jgi:hypothetical protein
MQTETIATTAIDTNEEYIAAENVKKQPAVLTSVFRSIFVETPKDFFGGIFGFFARYIRHFIDGFKYFWKPSLQVAPFEDKDFKEDCQRTFEFVLIVTGILIFMAKMNWIPSDEENMELLYSNDIVQMFVELLFFSLFAISYSLFMLITVMVGRLCRLLFSIPAKRRETDILFTYLNNSLFSIAVVVSFIFRCGIHGERVQDDEVFAGNVFAIYFLLFTPVIILWSIRFVKYHRMSWFRRILFILFTCVFFSIFFAYTSSMITFTILNT